MNIIKGTIREVRLPDGKPDQYGNSYQFIKVATDAGDVWGRIGCKKPYTANDVGQNGQWESTQETDNQGQTRNKFKKHYDKPYQGQQAPSASSGTSKDENVDWDAKDMRNARMAGLKAATQLICLMAEMMKIEVSPNTIKKTAAEFVDYIYNGLGASEQAGNLLGKPPEGVQTNPDWVGPDPPPPSDDIPF